MEQTEIKAQVLARKKQEADAHQAAKPKSAGHGQAGPDIGKKDEPISKLLQGWLLDNGGDRELADIIALKFAGRLAQEKQSGTWYTFWGTRWETDMYDEHQSVTQEFLQAGFRRLIKDLTVKMKKKGISEAQKNQLEALVQKSKRELKTVGSLKKIRDVMQLSATGSGRLGVSAEIWDKQPHLFQAGNAVVDLRTGRLLDPRPDYYLRLGSSVDYDPDAPRTLWLNTLDQIFGDDIDLKKYFQKVMGSALWGKRLHAYLYFFYGNQGREGKTLLISTFCKVLGSYATQVPVEILLESNTSKNPNAPTPVLENLKDRRMVWTEEPSDNRRFAAGTVKQMTGGGELEGRAVYGKQSVRFMPAYEFIIACNALPKWQAEDFALKERLKVIPFKYRFVDRDPIHPDERRADLELPDKLQEELPGILAWMVEGCLAWQREGLDPPVAVEEAGKSYLEEVDYVGAFLRDWTQPVKGAEIQAADLWDAYRTWCKQVGLREGTQTRFGRSLKNRIQKDDTRNRVYYVDIALTDEATAKKGTEAHPF